MLVFMSSNYQFVPAIKLTRESVTIGTNSVYFIYR